MLCCRYAEMFFFLSFLVLGFCFFVVVVVDRYMFSLNGRGKIVCCFQVEKKLLKKYIIKDSADNISAIIQFHVPWFTAVRALVC